LLQSLTELLGRGVEAAPEIGNRVISQPGRFLHFSDSGFQLGGTVRGTRRIIAIRCTRYGCTGREDAVQLAFLDQPRAGNVITGRRKAA
jgi:hypothetical protein